MSLCKERQVVQLLKGTIQVVETDQKKVRLPKCVDAEYGSNKQYYTDGLLSFNKHHSKCNSKK